MHPYLRLHNLLMVCCLVLLLGTAEISAFRFALDLSNLFPQNRGKRTNKQVTCSVFLFSASILREARDLRRSTLTFVLSLPYSYFVLISSYLGNKI